MYSIEGKKEGGGGWGKEEVYCVCRFQSSMIQSRSSTTYISTQDQSGVLVFFCFIDPAWRVTQCVVGLDARHISTGAGGVNIHTLSQCLSLTPLQFLSSDTHVHPFISQRLRGSRFAAEMLAGCWRFLLIWMGSLSPVARIDRPTYPPFTPKHLIDLTQVCIPILKLASWLPGHHIPRKCPALARLDCRL